MVRRMLGAILAAALVAMLPSGARGENLEALRQHALELVNQARQAQGRTALTAGDDLNEAAQAHARDMRERHYYSHTSPEGDDVRDRYRAAGGTRWDLVAENIARCEGCTPPATTATVEQLQQGWMNSPHHRENILREGLSRFGYGIVVDAGQGLYAVQTFAGPGSSRGSGDDTAAQVLAEDAVVPQAAQLINQARRQAGAGTLRASPALNEAARALLPDPGSDGLDLGGSNRLLQAVPEGERRQWRALSVLAGACGGCGTRPTRADLRFFRQQWLDDPQQKRQLLDPAVTGIGFALQANGQGRKVALLVLGTAR